MTLITSCPLFNSYMDAPELLLAVFYSNLNLLLNSQSLCDSEVWTFRFSTSTPSPDMEIPAFTKVALVKLQCAQESCESVDSDSRGLEWDLRACTSNKLPGDVDAGGPELPLAFLSDSLPCTVSGRNLPQFLAPWIQTMTPPSRPIPVQNQPHIPHQDIISHREYIFH